MLRCGNHNTYPRPMQNVQQRKQTVIMWRRIPLNMALKLCPRMPKGSKKKSKISEPVCIYIKLIDHGSPVGFKKSSGHWI